MTPSLLLLFFFHSSFYWILKCTYIQYTQKTTFPPRNLLLFRANLGSPYLSSHPNSSPPDLPRPLLFSPSPPLPSHISSNFLRYWGDRHATESDVVLSLLAPRSWSLPLDSKTWIMSLLVCGISLSPPPCCRQHIPLWKLDGRMERGEKINKWKINRKALDPSLIRPTGHLRCSQSLPYLSSLYCSLWWTVSLCHWMVTLIPFLTMYYVDIDQSLCQIHESSLNVSSGAKTVWGGMVLHGLYLFCSLMWHLLVSSG